MSDNAIANLIRGQELTHELISALVQRLWTASDSKYRKEFDDGLRRLLACAKSAVQESLASSSSQTTTEAAAIDAAPDLPLPDTQAVVIVETLCDIARELSSRGSFDAASIECAARCLVEQARFVNAASISGWAPPASAARRTHR